MESKLAIYQASNGEIKLKEDVEHETIWATKKELAQIFNVDRSVISRHISNIFKSEELEKKEVCAFFAHTTKHGAIKSKKQTRNLEYYNLDLIISVGYRVNSKVATNFRKWATKTLKEHIVQGYTINPERVQKNYDKFLQAIEDIKLLSNNKIQSDDVLELIKSFSHTWMSLESFDKDKLPKDGFELNSLHVEAKNLYEDVATLKSELMQKDEATKLFASEKKQGSLEGILGNVYQSVFGSDAYPSIEEKAAHLLYFVVKNHPFNDGNKRTGAFCFIWLLKKAGFDIKNFISPNALTTLTLLIAESNPKEKEKMIGLVLLMLRK